MLTRLQVGNEFLLLSSEEISTQSSESVYSPPCGRNFISKSIRGTIDPITPEVVATLDKCQISYRQAVPLVATIVEALGIDVNDVIINRSSSHRSRAKVREAAANKMKAYFQNLSIPFLIVHWDGKLIPDRLSCKRIDRLPILVTYADIEKIIQVPALEDGRAITIAKAVYAALNDWTLVNLIEGVGCDTTASNFREKGGAVAILEQILRKDLLQLACRHHMLEIVLAAVFNLKIPNCSGPNVPIFIKFPKEWPQIKDSAYENGLEILKPSLKEQIPELIAFIKRYMEKQLPRDDYKELLELA